MKYIYFDESGDLGFDFAKNGTSKYFSVAFLITENKRAVAHVVRKVFLSLPKAKKYKNNGVLHAYYEKDSTRNKLLVRLSEKDIRIATIRLEKHASFVAKNPHKLYADIISTLVNRLFADGEMSAADDIMLVASKRETSRRLNTKFKLSVASETRSAKFKIEIIRPYEDKCLQAVDFVSYAFWQKYEKGDSAYTDILADKIVGEYEYVESCESVQE